MKKTCSTIIFIFLLPLVSTLMAQNRFKAGAVIGFNLAQLDGDLQQGYDKFGLNLGLKGLIIIKPQFDISTELFFNQKGAAYTGSSFSNDNKTLFSRFTLNYADVLVLANMNLNPNESETFYRHSFHTGISFGRLLGSKTEVRKGNLMNEALAQNISQNYKTNDVSFIIGWSWFLNKKLGITIRHTLSLTNVYENPVNLRAATLGVDGYSSLRSYYLSAQLFYNFISPKNIGINKGKKKKKTNKSLEEL